MLCLANLVAGRRPSLSRCAIKTTTGLEQEASTPRVLMLTEEKQTEEGTTFNNSPNRTRIKLKTLVRAGSPFTACRRQGVGLAVESSSQQRAAGLCRNHLRSTRWCGAEVFLSFPSHTPTPTPTQKGPGWYSRGPQAGSLTVRGGRQERTLRFFIFSLPSTAVLRVTYSYEIRTYLTFYMRYTTAVPKR